MFLQSSIDSIWRHRKSGLAVPCDLVPYCGSHFWGCVLFRTHKTSDPAHSESLPTINQQSNQHPNMPFTAAPIATVFTNAANMGLLFHMTRAFAAKGITNPVDLAEFNKEGMLSIFRNLCKPAKVLRAGAAGARGKLQSHGL